MNNDRKNRMTKKTGGPAFPTQGYDHGAAMNGIGVTVTDQEGMSLRDYFAAKAMQSILTTIADEHWRDGVAIDAYAMADAMLKAREVSHDNQ